MIKIALILLSGLPLLLHSPYLLQAWQNSRLDHLDWLFFLAAVPAAVWALYKEKLGKFDFYALLVLVPTVVLTAFPALHNINALLIASAVGVLFRQSGCLAHGAWHTKYFRRHLFCYWVRRVQVISSLCF